MPRFQIVLLFSIALYRSFKCVVAATECEKNEPWKCVNGECVHINALCDGIKHCSDGSDETEEFCKNTECTPLSYRCDYGACISLNRLCDGVADCVDSSDEDSEKCRKRREEVPPDEVDDETNCLNCAGWGQMKCWSGQCISVNGKCNGIRDCDDGSDETSRLCKTMYYINKQLQCGYGACIEPEAKCNGTKECYDGTDEHPELCAMDKNTTKASITLTTIKMNVTKSSAENANTTTTGTTTLPMLEKNSNRTKSSFNHQNGKTGAENVNTTKKEKSQHPNIPKRLLVASAERDGAENLKSKSTTLDADSSASSRNQTQIHAQLQTSLISDDATHKEKSSLTRPTTTSHAPQYNMTSSILTPAPTAGMKHFSISPEARKNNCTLRGCGHPLICKISQLDSNHFSLLSDTIGRIFVEEDAQVTFACDKGFELQGVASITCTADGWSYAKPICAPVCEVDFLPQCKSRLKCLYKKSNMKSGVLITESFNEQMGEFNSQLDLSCVAGYLEGAASRICTASGWSKPLPSCIKYCHVSTLGDCQRPLNCATYNPNMGTVLPPGEYNSNLLRENSHITFSCDYGYNLVGTNRSTCNFNGWDNAVPKCIPVCNGSLLNACRYPLNCYIVDVESGQWLPFLYAVAADEQISVETYFAFTCTEGYELEGVEQLSCSANGWSHGMPKCVKKPKFCDTSLLLECGSGMICQIFDTKLDDFVKIEGGNKEARVSVNFQIELSCPNGYKLEGAQSLTCLENSWDNAMPKCVPPCRGNLLPKCAYPLYCFATYPQTPSKSYLLPANYTSYAYLQDTQVDFICSEGYKLKGAAQTVCTALGWSHEQRTLELPKCILGCDPDILLECKNPLTCYYKRPGQYKWLYITNGYKESMVVVNSHIDFKCSKGFSLQGASRVQCTQSGWSDHLPKCKYNQPLFKYYWG